MADLALVLEALRNRGVARIAVEYDGSGDEGSITEIGAYDSEGQSVDLEHEETDALQTYVWDHLASDWQDGEGSFGEFVFDLPVGELEHTHNERYIDYKSHVNVFELPLPVVTPDTDPHEH